MALTNSLGSLLAEHMKDFNAKILWEGSAYPTETQTCNFKSGERLSNQAHGIILVFSAASGLNNWSYEFVPKWHNVISSGAGVNVIMYNSPTSRVTINKYIYVNDTNLVGHTENDTVPHNDKVLRYVIGI